MGHLDGEGGSGTGSIQPLEGRPHLRAGEHAFATARGERREQRGDTGETLEWLGASTGSAGLVASGRGDALAGHARHGKFEASGTAEAERVGGVPACEATGVAV